MNYIKNKSVGFYSSVITALLAIISLIFLCVVAADGEGMSSAVYPMTIIGLILVVFNVVAVNFEVLKKYCNFGNALASLFFAVTIVMFFIGRMTWFINIASSNNVTPLYGTFIFTAVLIIVTWIVSIVNAFFKIEKEK